MNFQLAAEHSCLEVKIVHLGKFGCGTSFHISKDGKMEPAFPTIRQLLKLIQIKISLISRNISPVLAKFLHNQKKKKKKAVQPLN